MNQLDSSVARDPGKILLDLALEAPGKCVGIVGLAKNCGKTTVLNTLVREATSLGIPVGITSGGRDGELYDAITGLPKPPIHVPQGSLVALAESTLNTGSCTLAVVERLGVQTSAGEIVVAKALSPGHVEVIGCNHSHDLIMAVGTMRELGAELILLDGAAGRTFLASPKIVGAIVVATGAALNGSPKHIAELTGRAIHMFQLPKPPPDVADVANPLVETGASAILQAEGNVKVLPWKTILGKEKEVVSLRKEDDVGLICGKALGETLLTEVTSWLNHRRRLMSAGDSAPSGAVLGNGLPMREGFMVIGRDPSRIASGTREATALEASGGRLCVLEKAPVIAVSTNPTSPWRGPFNPREFAVEISGRIRELPVLDVVAGLTAVGGVVYETGSRP